METMLIRSAIVASAFLLCMNADASMAQSQSRTQQTRQTPQNSGSQSRSRVQTGQTAQPTGSQSKTGSQIKTGSQSKTVGEVKKPWKLSSRIHLEKGTNSGYLVVQLDLNEGFHVYSLNPKGSPSPTKLAVMPSNDLKVESKFVSKTAPKVIEQDPIFKQRIEKHAGQVQFFAPIIVRRGIDLQKLTQEVQFSGQICSESACQPIRNQTATATFGGFFELPKPRKAAATKQLK